MWLEGLPEHKQEDAEGSGAQGRQHRHRGQPLGGAQREKERSLRGLGVGDSWLLQTLGAALQALHYCGAPPRSAAGAKSPGSRPGPQHHRV